MRLLDLFCGAGGAAMGYHRAGFEVVVGVDIKPQPRYPFAFVQGDALAYVAAHGHEFDAIHASPPCQAYIRTGIVAKDGRHPDLLPATRVALIESGRSWVIENVPGAPMRPTFMLCGSMFGLAIRRHRYFEIPGVFALAPATCNHSGRIVGIYGHPCGVRGAAKGMLPDSLKSWSDGLGIDWMLPKELALAIPPAYTEYIGRQLLASLQAEAA